jgi:hypothetical protein
VTKLRFFLALGIASLSAYALALASVVIGFGMSDGGGFV